MKTLLQSREESYQSLAIDGKFLFYPLHDTAEEISWVFPDHAVERGESKENIPAYCRTSITKGQVKPLSFEQPN